MTMNLKPRTSSRPGSRAVALLICLLVLSVAGASGALNSGSAEAARTAPVTVTFWWWGNDEAPGLRVWIKETVAKFNASHANIKVKAVEQTTDGLVQAAQAAQAAQKGPDIQYYWPVGWMQNDMFNDGLAPLDELIPNEVKHYLPSYRNYATWGGHVYAMPFYSVGNPWVYRKDLFAKAGLDPEKPPRTFAQFLAAGRKLKAAGITPIGAGMKDQFYADWPWMLWQACGLNSPHEWFDAFLGRTKQGLEAPAYVQTWSKIIQTVKAGLYAPSVNSSTLYEGFNALLNGKAAMATPIAPTITVWSRKLGSKLGVMLTPCQNEGALASKYPDASQYVAIPAFSKHKLEAAQFLAFMHRPERMQALFRQTGAVMGDDRLQLPKITNPLVRQLITWSRTRSYFALYYTAPPTIDTWIWPNVGKIFAGKLTAEDAAKISENQNQRWLKQSRRLVRSFSEWQASVLGKG
jgi:raffinose/stachyose/melibiose transport system substrate-binding protein